MSAHAMSGSQPPPSLGELSVVDAVAADLEQRRAFGCRKYGTELRTQNGRRALVDAYQEALDLACYLKQVLMEQDATEAPDPSPEFSSVPAPAPRVCPTSNGSEA